MLSDEAPEWGARSPQHYGGSPIRILLYLENVDAVVERATAAGAKLVRPLKDEFYGDRTASVLDPFGYEWHVHTHIRDVSPEEMMKAAQQMAG
jgi:PhnB protein